MDNELKIRLNPESSEIELVANGKVIGAVDKEIVVNWMNIVEENRLAPEEPTE